MKHIGKRMLALLLALIFCVSLLPAVALAEAPEDGAEDTSSGADAPPSPQGEGNDDPDALPTEDEEDLPEGVVATGTCGDDLTWSLSDAGVLSIYGTGAMTDYKLNTHPGWYSYGTDITSVVFGTGVTSVGNYAFHGGNTGAVYPNLTWVAMSDTVTSVGSYAFYNCTALSDAALPSGLTTLKTYAFYATALTEVTIPGVLSEVSADAFRACASLQSLTIEYGVTKLSTDAFLNCTALESVTIPGSCTSFGSNVFKGCSSLEYVTLPSGLTTLGYSMFSGCTSLESITLPQSLTQIPYMAFYGCTSLAEITIPAGVSTLGDTAFGNTGLTEITFLGDAPTSIHASAFQNVTATVYYPGGNATWTSDLMQDYGGNLDWVARGQCGDAVYWTLENGVLTIYGSGAMWNYDMYNHPSYYASRGSFTSVVIEYGVTGIGQAAFLSCDQITSIEIPSGVTSIGFDAFVDCSSLTGIEIPASVTEIVGVPFLGCTSMTAINVDPANPAYQSKEGVLFSKDGTVLLDYPGGKAGAYALPGGVVSIGDEAFCQCVKLTKVVIPEGVTDIGIYTFNSCTLLTRVTIPESVTSIPVGMLANCPALESVTIPSGVTSVGMYAFASCTALEEITFLGSAPTINNYAFEGVTATAYYPSWDTTWTENVKQDYGGRITWVGYDEKCGEGVYWHLENGVLTIYGEGPMWDYGSELPGYYEFRESITSVVIEYGVTRIGTGAVFGCDKVTGVTIPDSVTEIGAAAFANCSSLTAITIPDSVTAIENRAFAYCSSLTDITIPAGVTDMGDYVFQCCDSLTAINVDPDNPAYQSQDGVLFSKDGTVLLEYPGGKAGAYAIPSGVVRIEQYAFYYCKKLTSVVIPEGVTQLGAGAFYSCKMLESVTIPESVTGIPVDAFASCTALKRVTIPSGVTSLGNSAFSNCSSLTAIGFTGSAPTIANTAFRNVTATAYYPAGDETWTEDVMQDYGGTITWVGYDGQCGDTVFWHLTDGVLIIFGSGPMWDYYSDYPDYHAYEETITSVVIKNGVTHIGNFAFFRCEHFTGIMIPSSVTSIGDKAFAYCEALTDVTISSSVTEIGSLAFLCCGSLTAINVDPANPAYQSKEGVLLTKNGMRLLEYPGGKAGAYTVPDGVAYIEEQAFIRCTQLTSVTFPEGVSIIMKYAFTNCSSLSSVTLPESMAGIWEGAFERCTSLENVTIPAGVTYIGDFAFGSCSSLTVIEFKGNAPTIKSTAFYNVTATAYYHGADETWTEDVMQDYRGHITWEASDKCGDHAFWKLENGVLTIVGEGPMWDFDSSNYPGYYESRESITSVVIESGVTRIGSMAFLYCGNITGITIPSGVISIGNNAFAWCKSLTDVTIPSGVTSIEYYAFYGCTSLTGIEIPASVTTIGTVPFMRSSSLTAINVDPANPAYQSKEGVLFSKDGTTLLEYPGGKAGAYTVPDGVTSINNEAFKYCAQLTSVTIPEGVTDICARSFDNCSALESVTIGKDVTNILAAAFAHCSSLTEITFTGSAPTIANNAFSGVTATAYYPAGDETWTEDVMQDYSGHITWVSYEPEPSHIPGDINGDGVVNNKDVTRLVRYLKDPTTAVNEAALDVNGDGRVTNKDVTRLVRYLKHHDVEIF